MKRLQLRIFALATALVLGVIVAGLVLLPPATLDVRFVALVAAIGLLGAFAVSGITTRMVLGPLGDVRRLATELTGGRRDPRLHWAYGDERDATAIALNRMADRLGRELAEARRELQQLEAVMAGMVEGVLVLDLRDRILLVNPGFRELFGIWGPVRDRPVFEVLRQPEIESLLEQARERAEPVVRDLPVRGGSDRIVLAHAVRFPAAGPPAGILAVFHDVTEVRRVDKVRRDFIANASHELRTPLTSIQGYAETLGGDLAKEDADRALQTILRNVSRMRDLIDDLMELSRIEHAAYRFERSRVDVVRLARELLADLRKRLDAAEITAEIDAGESAEASCDRGALLQVLENLLTNAIRYTDAGGQIRVEITPKADLLEIAVADTGIGIPEEARDRIFERFYRVDAARSRAVGSTGLGLAIVRHLVQGMGGTIRVESELGVGSRFVFSVPRAPGAADRG